MPRVVVELDSVRCRETEDTGWFGSSDELYFAGAVSGGPSNKPVLTAPVNIDNGQTKRLDATLFDGPVPAGYPIRLSLAAFDEDSGKEWADRQKLTDLLQERLDKEWATYRPDGTTTGPYDPTNEQSRGLLNLFIDGLQYLATLDKDDRLGTLTKDIPVNNNVLVHDGVYAWNFWGDDSNYTALYRVTTIQDGATDQQVAAFREERRRKRDELVLSRI